MAYEVFFFTKLALWVGSMTQMLFRIMRNISITIYNYFCYFIFVIKIQKKDANEIEKPPREGLGFQVIL